jgi:hypothetical protein
MKTIKQDELFENLGAFFKAKGIELTDGDYARRIRRGCDLLTGVINTTQKTVRHAKAEADKKLDQLRQTIHEATAPKPPPPPAQPASSPGSAKDKEKARSPRRPSPKRAAKPPRKK